MSASDLLTCLLLMLLPCARAVGQSLTDAEAVITVKFQNGYALPEDDRRMSHGFLVPVRMRNDSVMYDATTYPVSYPENMDPDSVVIAEDYFAGNTASPLPLSALYLIYPYPSPYPTLYLDTTGTFTFTNTPSFDYVAADSNWMTVNRNAINEQCAFVMQYEPANWESEERKAKFVPHFQDAGPLNRDNESVEPEYWFRDRRKNFRFSSFSHQGVDYRIALCDYDCNGKYTDAQDRILFNLGDSLLSENLAKDGYEYVAGMLIGVSEQAFRVLKVEECGGSVQLLPVDLAVARSGLTEGSFLADLAGTVTVDRSMDLRSLKTDKEYLLLDLWGSWCKGCLQAIPELKNFYAQYSDRVELIGINLGDSAEAIAGLEVKYGMNWPSWSISQEQVGALNVQGYPTYLLFSQEGKLLISSSRVTEIVERVKR